MSRDPAFRTCRPGNRSASLGIRRTITVGAILVTFLGASQGSAGAPWAPIPPNELALTKGTVDPQSDAEMIFRDIRVEDAMTGPSVYSEIAEYRRIRIYTKRGVEAHASIEIPYDDRTEIKDLAARTIRPDGSVVEVARKTIFDRTLVKAGSKKLKVKTFALPDLQVGSMIDYRWTRRQYDAVASNVEIDLQLDLPVQSTTLAIKPISILDARFQFRARSFNMATPMFERTNDGFQKAVWATMPAARSEPYMPPTRAVRPWLLLGYEDATVSTPERVWKEYAVARERADEDAWRVDASIREAARTAIQGASSDDEKLERLYEFVRTRVINVYDDVHGVTIGEQERVAKQRAASAALKAGKGTGLQVNRLFAALASAAGFQVRMAELADRSQAFFSSEQATPYFLTEHCVAVWAGLSWRFYDPSARYIPAGHLPWWEEGQQALLIDPEEAKFVTTPMAEPDWSADRHSGVFAIDADGTLEGDARDEYSGHYGAFMKEEMDESSDAERVKAATDRIVKRIPSAQVTALRFEHATDPTHTVTMTYHIRVPMYAQRAGKRLIFEPCLFRRGSTPVFTNSERTHPIYFPYAWSSSDSVAIRLPAGFTVEALPPQEPLFVPGVASYRTSLASSMDGTSLVSLRSLQFGQGGTIYFPADQYSRLKQAFDSMHERDGQSVVLSTTGTRP